MNPFSADIERVAMALGDLKDRCFLTGGASIPFYITDKLEESPRATLDIDVVMDIAHRAEFQGKIEARLRERGFANDMTPGAPLCRWKLQALIVDIMPTDASVLGFTNPWYQIGLSSTMAVSITKNCSWRILSPPFALAAKCAAFWDRGIADPGASEDLEDIISLVNGRPELLQESTAAPDNCRNYLAESITKILRNSALTDVIPYHLPAGRIHQQRLPIVLERMRSISALLAR